MLRLQGYQYTVAYHPGKTNIADALSRLNQTNPKYVSGEQVEVVRMIVEESTPVALTARDVEIASGEDPELTSVRHYIQHDNLEECMPIMPRMSSRESTMSARANAENRAANRTMARRRSRRCTSAARARRTPCCDCYK